MFSSRISLARSTFTADGCSMKITEDVRKFAAEQKISEEQALQVGLEQKAKEFVKKGSEIYAKGWSGRFGVIARKLVFLNVWEFPNRQTNA
jgi:hypothetical protein